MTASQGPGTRATTCSSLFGSVTKRSNWSDRRRGVDPRLGQLR
ncbi:hypothetical protein ACFPRL_24180 [Pseudoclavibacter helvolus]